MSKQGVTTAIAHGAELPGYGSLEEARDGLWRLRASCIQALVAALTESVLDFSLESLNALEQWFFAGGQPSALPSGMPRSTAIAFYFGEVLVRHRSFTWVVEPYFMSPGRYEIGVRRGLTTIMLTRGIALSLRGNKSMRSLSRMVAKYAA